MAFAVGLSASPINGGACNGGGTLAQFQGISCLERGSLPYDYGGYYIQMNPSLEPFYIGDTSLIQVSLVLDQTASAATGVTFDLIYRLFGTFSTGQINLPLGTNGGVQFNIYGNGSYQVVPVGSYPSGITYDSATGIVTISEAGTYDVSVRAEFAAPEPTTYALCAVALGLLALQRLRVR